MNRIFSEQLVNSLNTKLVQIYYLVGQDPLLLAESADLIWQSASQQGFDEKVVVDIDHNTDWQELFERCQSLGLFFDKQVIYLNLPENINQSLQGQLTELISLSNPDLLFVLQLPKLAKLAEKQSWVKKSLEIEPHLVLVNCQTPSIEQLPRWLSQRLKNIGLEAEQDAIHFLCYSHENNLLALKQSLDLLALLYSNQRLTLGTVQKVVEQSSIFTPFQWIDALLEGKFQRAKRILDGLYLEETQPVILLRTLQRELIILLELTKPQQRLTSIEQPLSTQYLKDNFDRLKIWQNRRPLYLSAIQRLNYKKLYMILQELAELERILKSDFSTNTWENLIDISAKISFSK